MPSLIVQYHIPSMASTLESIVTNNILYGLSNEWG